MNGSGECRREQPTAQTPSLLARYEGRKLLGAVLNLSAEPGELLQLLCNDNRTIGIVNRIIRQPNVSQRPYEHDYVQQKAVTE